MDLTRRMISAYSAGGKDYKVGDIVYVANGNICSIDREDWISTLGTPIGVVVIAKDFLPDKKCRIVSLMGCGEYAWDTSSGTDTTLTNYNVFPTSPSNAVVSNLSNNGCFATDYYSDIISYYDPESGYLTDSSSNYIISPYNQSGEYNNHLEVSASGYNNAFTDMDGKNNTLFLCNLGSRYKAANIAHNYTDGVSDLEWHLPSFGELGMWFARAKLVDESLQIIGAETLPRDIIQCSTEVSSTKVWTISAYKFTATATVVTQKNRTRIVRPFAIIE